MNKFTGLFFASLLVVTFLSFVGTLNASQNLQNGVKDTVNYKLLNQKVVLK